jgi:hypothetical protein
MRGRRYPLATASGSVPTPPSRLGYCPAVNAV